MAAVVVAGKAGKTGPGQTKPRLGTTGKPAKPKQGFLIIFWGGIPGCPPKKFRFCGDPPPSPNKLRRDG